MFREFPVAIHGVFRDVEHFGGFLHTEAAKEAQFDNAALSLVDQPKSVQCLIQREQVRAAVRKFCLRLLQRHPVRLTSAFLALLRARVIREDMPHGMRTKRKEVSAVTPLDLDYPGQSNVDLIHQSGSLESVTGPLPRHALACD